jgi:hypothetical protein
MNEMERDYLTARAFVAAFVDEAVKLFLTVVVIFIVLWIIGVILMFWPIALLVAIVWAVWAYASGPAPDPQFLQTLAVARAALPSDMPNVRWDECAIRTADGEFIAPNFATLLQWVREGRVPPQSSIFTCDGGTWRIAYDIEQLAPLLNAGARFRSA